MTALYRIAVPASGAAEPSKPVCQPRRDRQPACRAWTTSREAGRSQLVGWWSRANQPGSRVEAARRDAGQKHHFGWRSQANQPGRGTEPAHGAADPCQSGGQRSRASQPGAQPNHRGERPRRFSKFSACACLIIKFRTALVCVRTWSGLPNTGGHAVMLQLPIRISDSPENLKTPQGLCTMLVYVEIGADTSRLLYFPTLATADLGLCSEGSSIL